MLGKSVLSSLVLPQDVNHCKHCVERDLLEVFDGHVRVTLVDKFVEIHQVDKFLRKLVSFERHLGLRITSTKLRDE